ncbi:MAG: hypothetical protein RIT52_1076 [Pseudomonadota bacterium]|jgi:hypothetical protein
MPNILLLKRSAVAGRAPVPADLVLGELAVNVTDGKLYLKKSTSGVESIVDVTAGGMTDAELFAKVTTQDGAGSGLDADLLDGTHASAFAQLAGATFTGVVTAPNFVSSSDARLKSDIAPISDALAKVQALTGVTFTMTGSDVRQMGLIAQDVQAVAPEAVVEAEGILRLAYGNLVGLLVEAIKDLAQEVDQLKRTAP